MSNLNSFVIWLLVALVVSACSGTPKPVPGSTATQPTVTAPAADIDYNRQIYAQAVAALKKGRSEEALKLLQRVSREAPDKPYVFTNLGLTYLKLQQFEFAEQAFAEAIERNQRDAVAYNHLGILQRHKGRFDDARQQYQRAIEIDSAYARAHLNLGILFDIYLQDLTKALAQYQKYQSLIRDEDSQVSAWIVDIERRLKSPTSQSQG